MSDGLRVLQLVDSLAAGGTERMAVGLANALSSRVELSALCATRQAGPLEPEVQPGVLRLRLDRRRTFDLLAMANLRSFVREHRVSVVHAHSTSIYFAAAALTAQRAGPSLIWHDHNSRFAERRQRHTRLAGRLCHGTYAASDDIAAWQRRAGVAATKISMLPNFIDIAPGAGPSPELPGQIGSRVVSVANLRPEKNHVRLVRAFGRVLARCPKAHLLLVGSLDDKGQVALVRSEVERLGLEDQVTLLGVRSDVGAILAGCDVGVLPSLQEGLPVALLEYGAADLPTVTSPVGQVPEVTDGGTLARLVDPADEVALATAIGDLLDDEDARRVLGRSFGQSVRSRYAAASVVPSVVDRYRFLSGLRTE